PFQHLGMGEAWYSIAGTRQVTTEFKLWNMEGTPYSTADDVLMATDGGLFANMDYVDKSVDYGGDHNYGAFYTGLSSPDCATNPTLRIEQPTATGYVDASFRFTATGSSGGAPTSGGPQTSLATSNAFTTYYNNQWVTITVPLPTSYDAPTPPGETQPGWWKIQYNVGTSGQDVTTWEVNIRGNPVPVAVPVAANALSEPAPNEIAPIAAPARTDPPTIAARTCFRMFIACLLRFVMPAIPRARLPPCGSGRIAA